MSWGHAWKYDLQTKITPVQLCRFKNDHEESKNIPVNKFWEICLNQFFSNLSINKKKICIQLTH